MAADKTIFECPVYSLYTQLDGGQRLVVQPSSGATQDYGLPLSLLSQWLFANYQVGVLGGSPNPDPSAGNNGDLYFQNNGKIYQKTSGGWVLKATIPTNQEGEEVAIPTGSAIPFAITYAPYITHGNNPVLEVYLKNDANNKTLIYDVQVKCTKVSGVLTTLNVYGHGVTTTDDDLILIIK